MSSLNGGSKFDHFSRDSKDCEECRRPLSGSIKTFDGRKFHADCFKCDDCREVLSGNVFPVNGTHICQACVTAKRQAQHRERELESRHAREQKATREIVDEHASEEIFESPGDCNQCRRPVEEQFFVRIGHDIWHTNCFKCNDCRAVLDPDQHSTAADGKTRLCYECDPSKRCTGCNDVIYVEATEFKGQHYHPNCFTCHECRALLTGRVIVKDDRNLCEDCHQNEIEAREDRIHRERMMRHTAATVATRTDRSVTIDATGFDFECSGTCTECHMPIEDKTYVKFDDQMLHRPCFKCAVCQGVLDPHKHSTLPDRRRVCFGCDPEKQCDKCHDVIWDDATEFQGRRFHPDCFRCEECSVALTDRVILKNDRNVCERCFEDIREIEERNRVDEFECVGLCTKCRDPIEDQFYVRLDDGLMHTNCFRCHNCRVELDPKEHSVLPDGRTRVCYRCDPSKECQKCFETIFEDAAEFKGKRYHPTCFRCADCNTLLSDHVVVRDGRNICEPCWGAIQAEEERNHKDEYECAGICTTCYSPIEDKFYVRLDDGLLHTNCFRCNTCKVELNPKEHSLLPDGHTRVCFKCDPSKQCEACRKVIYDEATDFKGKHYHPKCFNCEECRAPLTERVIVKDKRNVCERCYDRIREREERMKKDEFECVGDCDACRKPIEDKFYVRLDDGLRHTKCFKCNVCKVSLDPKMHSTLPDRSRVCFNCDPSKKCTKCRRVIPDDAAEYKGERFHPECFTCDDCRCHLTDRVFVKDNNKYCEACAKKPRGRNTPAPRQEAVHRISTITRDRPIYQDMTVQRREQPLKSVRPATQTATDTRTVTYKGRTMCDVCRDPIEDQYFVRVEDKQMHKRCFKCHDCKAVLDPKFHTTMPDGRSRICYRCDPTKQCEACRKTIYEDASEFKGKRYHPKCFTCDGCYAHLTGRVFMKDGLKFCEECKNSGSHRQVKAQRYAQNTMTVTTKTLRASDQNTRTYATNLSRSFSSDPNTRSITTSTARVPGSGQNGAVVTTSSYRSQTSTGSNGDCSRCRQGLSGSVVAFDGRKFHSDCFRCDGCNDKLSGNVFPSQGKNFCRACKTKPAFGGGDVERCAGCRQSIAGACKAVGGKKFHPNCFICSQCRSVLNGSFGMRGENPVCTSCLRR